MGCYNDKDKKKRLIKKKKQNFISLDSLKNSNYEKTQIKDEKPINTINTINKTNNIKKIEENFMLNEKFKRKRKLSLSKTNTEKNFSKLEKLKINSKSQINPQMIYQKNFLNSENLKDKHLLHLLTTLYKKTNNTEKNDFKYMTEFIEWIQSKNTINGNIWINNGKKVFTKEEIKNIYSLSIEEIKKENFLKRRIWISCYIQEVISEQIIDNSYLIINRNNILEDSLNQFKNNKEINLKRPLYIFFINEDCTDIGGMYREYFSSIFKEFFSEKNNFFKELHRFFYFFLNIY